eukprot:6472788-Amphidinium_carterae.5
MLSESKQESWDGSLQDLFAVWDATAWYGLGKDMLRLDFIGFGARYHTPTACADKLLPFCFLGVKSDTCAILRSNHSSLHTLSIGESSPLLSLLKARSPTVGKCPQKSKESCRDKCADKNRWKEAPRFFWGRTYAFLSDGNLQMVWKTQARLLANRPVTTSSDFQAVKSAHAKRGTTSVH